MRIDILTIFPKMFEPVFNESIIRRAKAKGKVKIFVHDLRDYSPDKHRKVDDHPFGGGSGMVMRVEPIFNALEKIPGNKKAKVVLLCPKGEKLRQEAAKKLAASKHLILVCGHYEGVDERVREHLASEEISIGDYVLTGGELPAMVLVDCLVRLLPGVLGDKNSLKFESFEGNLLEYPQYTRPAEFKGWPVPGVLLSGNHQKIEKWRQDQSALKTRQKRPDLLKKQRIAPRANNAPGA